MGCVLVSYVSGSGYGDEWNVLPKSLSDMMVDLLFGCDMDVANMASKGVMPVCDPWVQPN
jgi:hypothetical protein